MRSGKIDVAEVLVLARVLEIPPTLLLFPSVSTDGPEEVLPGYFARNEDVARWMAGVISYPQRWDWASSSVVGEPEPPNSGVVLMELTSLLDTMLDSRANLLDHLERVEGDDAEVVNARHPLHLDGRRALRCAHCRSSQSSGDLKAKLEYDLAPLRERYGLLPVQRLTKAHIDTLVTDLVAGGTTTAKGRQRKPWSAASVNKVIATNDQVLADAKAQGIVPRNVAEFVNRVATGYVRGDTYTEAEVLVLLSAIAENRFGHAWELALSGLRRGEVAGLRWIDIDLELSTLAITNNCVSADGQTVENDPKSVASRRTLLLPERLVSVLRAAKARQAAERLALGAAGGPWEYVVCNEVGQPYAPPVLSRYWRDTVRKAAVRHIKLHAARHTCATLMHLQGVPAAVIAAWIGHKDASLTMKLYGPFAGRRP